MEDHKMTPARREELMNILLELKKMGIFDEQPAGESPIIVAS